MEQERDDRVEGPRELALQPPVTPIQTAGEHEVGAAARLFDHARDGGRVVLEVAGHDDRVVGIDAVEAGSDRDVLAEISNQPHAMQP